MVPARRPLRKRGVSAPWSRLALAEGRRENEFTGEVAEWSNAAVLKTVDGVNRPGVRIPPSPPYISANQWSFAT